MARLPYPDPASLPDEVRSLVENLPPLNIFRMLPHADALVRPFAQLGTAILGRASLDPRLRELAILRVAAGSPAAYEWQQHVRIGRLTGVTDDEIRALERGDLETPSFGERERALLRFTDELLAGPRASDPSLAAMRAVFSDREICEAILTIGYYMMVARFLETTGVDLEPDAGDAAATMFSRIRGA